MDLPTVVLHLFDEAWSPNERKPDYAKEDVEIELLL